MSRTLMAVSAAAVLSLFGAAQSQAGVTLSGTVTYYSDFSENYGANITFSSPFASDSFTSINNTADYGGVNTTPGWLNGNTLYGADLVGTISAPATGDYTFSFGVDDAAYVFVNGGLVAWIGGGNDFCCSGAPQNVTVALGAGANALEIQYANEDPNQSALVFTAVPEPATWALMLVGFGALGFALRRRAAAAVAA